MLVLLTEILTKLHSVFPAVKSLSNSKNYAFPSVDIGPKVDMPCEVIRGRGLDVDMCAHQYLSIYFCTV